MKISQIAKICHRKMVNTRSYSAASTVDKNEMEIFKKFVSEWWDLDGPMKALHSMNKLRIPFIREGLINTGQIPKNQINTPQPLLGVNILDVGCGGGILSEPLSRLGCHVTGLDANSDIIEKAKSHALDHKLQNIKYVASSIEEHAIDNFEKYDAIVASEVVEHVSNKDDFIKACTDCLKPEGSIFVTTLSKTFMANVLGIFVAEKILRLLPVGTHEIDKFIKPHDLQRILEVHDCKTEAVYGMTYNFLTNTWFWIPNTSVNYALHATKLKKA